MTTSTLLETDPRQLAGKYLTFMLGPETYGIEILQVQEIIGMLPITRLPKVSEYIRGVINLRGKVIPVMNLAHRFGLPPRDDTSLSCIIVIQLSLERGTITMGVVVDEVSEVVDIDHRNTEEAPDLGGAMDSSFIRGIGKIGDKVAILLDMSSVVALDAIQALGLTDGDL